MPRLGCVKTVEVVRTPRVMQLEGLFDLPPAQQSEMTWSTELPLESRDWRIGLIVGPSGCGKTTLARALFPRASQAEFSWPEDRALVDAFPAALGIREIAELLSSVGFSSPPAWLRPFRTLSNGEQFRVTVARALAEPAEVVLIDEYSSVVDRTVARVASAAVARTIRRDARRFVAVTCHYDIIDWLQPDWMYDPAVDEFTWRCLRPRPEISLEIRRAERHAWRMFKRHHYLTGDLNPAARAFVARVEGRPAAFTAVLSHPDAHGGYWREHRTVCLPDFQGVGIGHALSEFVASLFAATGKRYLSVTSHPGMIAHRLRSPLWSLYRRPSFGRQNTGSERAFNATAALLRRTAGFRYVGPRNTVDALRFGLKVPPV
jgi:GNAT superfamily N-acetyltransferase